MITDLLRDKNKQKFIYFDFETLHVNLLADANNLPWQCTYFMGEGKNIINKYDRFPLWDPLPISKGAANVTKFDFAKYKSKAEDPKGVLEHFESFIFNPDYLIIAHNGLGFDAYILNIWRSKFGKKPDFSFIPRFIDTHALSKGLILERKPNSNENLVAYQYKMMSIIKKGLKTNVGAMCAHFGIPFDKELAHDGLYDVERTYDIFWKLIYNFDI